MSGYSTKKSQNDCVHLVPGYTSLVIILIAFLVLFAPITSYPADVTLSWEANIEPDLAGYRIYHREDGQIYDYNQPAWEGSDTVCTIYSLNDSIKYCFVARAFDAAGNESGDSTEVCFQESNNNAPTASAGPDRTVDEGTLVTLNGSNSLDPDYTVLSYNWTQKAGTEIFLSDPASVQPTFVAPSVSVTGEALIFELTVEDDGGLSDSDTVIINVSNINQAPTASAGPDQTVKERNTVTLDGSNTFDPDGTVVSYCWTQIGGIPVTLSNTEAIQVIFTAPDVTSEASLTFKLTVVDDGGLRSEDTCIVNVSWVNMVPIADAGPDQTVNEGVMVTLDGSNSTDSEDIIAEYLWKQTAGSPVTLSDAASAQTTFLAPYVNATEEALKFELTVQDGGGLADTDTVIINVADDNLPPVADAGDDQMVEDGNTVSLDSSKSWDPDGDVVSHLWKQTDGTPVTLSNPRAVNPTFAPPRSARTEVLKFQVTVTDTGELSSADNVDINVYPSSGNTVQTIFDLEAKAIGKGIRLDWSPAPDTTGYNIYRSCNSGGPYSQIGQHPANDKCTYLDNDILFGVTYYYLIRSVKGEAESLDSNKASATSSNRGKK
ncbi:MAG: hypothetical protein KAV87_57290 [Desulfobacteraceae bacterium]|nr:hypothetical protein [Desulfobacteraceae bacterium]